MSTMPLFDTPSRSTPDGFWTVSALTGQIKDLLEGEFADVGLVGEITGLSRPKSGHVYFSLKDDRATISAVMWKSTASKLVFELENGQAVRVRGDVTVYEPRGQYQIQVRKIEPEGIGALELAFRQMFQRLRAEGLFDPSRKRGLPRFPRRIIVIASPTGAAVRDFLLIVGRRWPAVEVLLAPSRVQGAGAAEEIAGAIALANQVAGTDLIVLARGGGSLEDIWPFNEEVVARAIFGSRVPVVSAVGHEVDVTIADYVADFRAATPSEAAERCVPDRQELAGALQGLAGRMAGALRMKSDRARLRVERQGVRLASVGERVVRDAGAAIEQLRDRAEGAMTQALDRRRQRLAQLSGQLDALSPLAVLARGYSLTLREDRVRILRDARDAQPGDRIVTRLAEGVVISRVESVEP